MSENCSDDDTKDNIDSISSGSGFDEILSDYGISDDGSVNNVHLGAVADGLVIHHHEPMVFNTIHCPPFESIVHTLFGECDCLEFGMEVCGQTDEFQFFSELDFVDRHIKALETADSLDRVSSNLIKKSIYISLFDAIDFGILEKKERRKLPNCVVARIRQIYPSKTGDYMGFKES